MIPSSGSIPSKQIEQSIRIDGLFKSIENVGEKALLGALV